MRDTLEHLVSKNSLGNDVGLQSMMDTQLRLPITALLEHDKFKSSHPEATMQDVINCLLAIPTVEMDSSHSTVRLLQTARCTLILHSIPPNVTADQICGLFETPVSVKPDVNNTWFVTFTSEQVCLDAAFRLQNHSGPTPWITDGPIACCVKTVTPLRRPMAPPSPYLAAQFAAYGQEWDALDPDSQWESNKPKTFTPLQSLPSPMLGWSRGARSSTVSCQEMSLGEPAVDIAYLHEFRKFERPDIIAICEKMTSIRKPQSLEVYSKGLVPFGEFEGIETDPPEFILDEPLREWATERRLSEVSRNEGDRRKSPHYRRKGERRKSGTSNHCGKTTEYGTQSYSYTPARKSTKSNDTNDSRAKSDGGLSWAKKMRDSLAKVEPEES